MGSALSPAPSRLDLRWGFPPSLKGGGPEQAAPLSATRPRQESGDLKPGPGALNDVNGPDFSKSTMSKLSLKELPGEIRFRKRDETVRVNETLFVKTCKERNDECEQRSRHRNTTPSTKLAKRDGSLPLRVRAVVDKGARPLARLQLAVLALGWTACSYHFPD